jgi:hypothetical protein
MTAPIAMRVRALVDELVVLASAACNDINPAVVAV